jgi:hypothetical protein
MESTLKRCTRCILPETFPHIKFNTEGVCSVCLDYDQRWAIWKQGGRAQTSQKLARIFDNVKKLGLKYDCLVPFSGGKDSAYVLYVCKHVYKLNALAFNFNNGFQTEEAIKNIQHAVKLLDVDLVTIGPRWSLLKELYRGFLSAAGETCTPCNMGIELGAYRIARQERIPLIVSGYSPRTEECSPKEVYFYDKNYFMKVASQGTTLTGSLYQDLEGDTPFAASFFYKKLSNLGHKYFIRTASLRLASWFNIPMRINLPEYIEWNEDEIFETLKNKMNWAASRVGKDHTDCEISPVKNYLRYQHWGFSGKVQKYAALVRDGQMSRDTALALIQDDGQTPAESLAILLNRLELPASQLEGLHDRTHLNYL